MAFIDVILSFHIDPANPPGGYSWMFERRDQEGVGHMSRKFDRPTSTLRKAPKGSPQGPEGSSQG